MTAIIDLSAVDRPVIVITRDFDAPRELVWKAITDPKQVALWYGGPGFINPVCEMDLRPGGAWHHVMQAPNGTRYTIESIFEEIVEPERLVWRTTKDPNRNPPPPTSHNTITLEERGRQTRWMLVTLFDSIVDRDMAAKMGFGQMISMGTDRMAGVGTEIIFKFRALPHLPLHEKWTAVITDFTLNQLFRDTQNHGAGLAVDSAPRGPNPNVVLSIHAGRFERRFDEQAVPLDREIILRLGFESVKHNHPRRHNNEDGKQHRDEINEGHCRRRLGGWTSFSVLALKFSTWV